MVCQMPIDTEHKIQLKYNLKKKKKNCDYELEWWFNGYLDYFLHADGNNFEWRCTYSSNRYENLHKESG